MAVDESSAATDHPASLGVDDTIARRRAELRRLQENRGRCVAGVVGVGAGGKHGLLRPGSGRVGGLGVAATAALVNRADGGRGSAAPAGGRGRSTAAFARLLDDPRGPSKPPAAAKGAPPPAKRRPPPQSTLCAVYASEIFHTGIDRDAAVSPERISGSKSPGKPRARRLIRDSKASARGPPKSPLFGRARVTIHSPAKAVPAAVTVPSLMVESVDWSASQGQKKDPPPTAPSAEQQQPPIQKSAEKYESRKSTPTISVQTEVEEEVSKDHTDQEPVEKNNTVSTNTITAQAEVEDEVSKEQSPPEMAPKNDAGNVSRKEQAKSQEPKLEERKADLVKEIKVAYEQVFPSNSSDVSHLTSDFQRTEREKREELEQVDKLKSLMERGKQQQNESESNQPLPQQQSHRQQSGIGGTPSGLLEQFKEMVSARGDSATVAWISEQLEHWTKKGRSTESPPSVMPSLACRGRPGSRAASPKRGSDGSLPSQSVGRATDGAVSSRGKRATAPLPKQLNMPSDNDDVAEGSVGSERESIERRFLIAAAKSIPNEYVTCLASYLVRRPYVDLEGRVDGVSTGNENDVWESYSHLAPKEQYLHRATAFDPSSLEILAYVEVDGSVFTLTGESNACHGKLPVPYGSIGKDAEDGLLDWAVIDHVEEMDHALGRVSYIDAEGNEKEYWLDSIYEEALTTRESYCMSMISAAFALKEVTTAMGVADLFPIQSVSPTVPTAQQPIDASLAESSQQPPSHVGADDLPMKPPPIAHGHASSTQFTPTAESTPLIQVHGGADKLAPPISPPVQKEPPTEPKRKPNLDSHRENVVQPSPFTSDQKQSTPATKPAPPGDEYEYESAESALPILVISLFSFFFSLVWFVVKIPFQFGSMFFIFWFCVVALRILWLLLADDNGAWEIGAGVDYEYNMPGIQ